jgi:outer membrane protein assembly factor BamB
MRPLRFGVSLFLLSGLALEVVAHVDAQDRGIADFPKLSAERDWPWWRGPYRNGIAEGTATAPTKWSSTENVVWKSPVPGRGHSSPIVVGDKVFLETADEASRKLREPAWPC